MELNLHLIKINNIQYVLYIIMYLMLVIMIYKYSKKKIKRMNIYLQVMKNMVKKIYYI